MLLQNLLLGPSPGPIELGHHSAAIGELHLVDAILERVERVAEVVALQTARLYRGQNPFRRQGQEQIGWTTLATALRTAPGTPRSPPSPGPPRDEPQGGRVDAVAQTGRLRTVVEDVAQVGVAVLAADLGAEHAQLWSCSSTMFPGSSGRVKLGQPVPDLYLSVELNSGSPVTTST